MMPLTTIVSATLLTLCINTAIVWQVQDWRYANKEVERVEAQVEIERNNRKVAQVASEGLENDKTRIEIRYRTIDRQVEKIINRPVYRNVCVDDDGLRLLNEAITEGRDSGKP